MVSYIHPGIPWWAIHPGYTSLLHHPGYTSLPTTQCWCADICPTRSSVCRRRGPGL